MKVAGNLLPNTFSAATGQIAAGDVIITGSSKDSGCKTGNDEDSHDSRTCLLTQKTSSGDEWEWKWRRNIDETYGQARGRYQRRMMAKRAVTLGWKEGHDAARRFTARGTTLGLSHSYIRERMASFGLDEAVHMNDFKRSFEDGHRAFGRASA